MKKKLQIVGLVLITALFVSCQDNDQRNYEYMPNMYQEVSYEAYGSYDVFPNTMEAMYPAPGSVKRGWMPYEYENNIEGYQAAKANLKNPVPNTEDNYNKGKELYTLYCAICHGDKGNGKGTLAEREKILGVPAYNDAGRAITEGSVYHVMYYGINTMGSYATQTTNHELWQIDHYVMGLKSELNGDPAEPFVETTTAPDVDQAGQPGSMKESSAMNADGSEAIQTEE